MFLISLGRISPSVAKVTGRKAAHFHILTDIQVKRADLPSVPFLYLCACVHTAWGVFNCAINNTLLTALVKNSSQIKFTHNFLTFTKRVFN